jgi:hypothetical protein
MHDARAAMRDAVEQLEFVAEDPRRYGASSPP